MDKDERRMGIPLACMAREMRNNEMQGKDILLVTDSRIMIFKNGKLIIVLWRKARGKIIREKQIWKFRKTQRKVNHG